MKLLSISFDMCIHLDNQVISPCITLKLLAVTKNKELEYYNYRLKEALLTCKILTLTNAL